MHSGDWLGRPQPKAAAGSYEVSVGPAYLNGTPNQEKWLAFNEYIKDPEALAFAGLWHQKAKTADSVPLRKDFSFKELVEFGRFLTLYKLTEDDRWLTTFCGEEVAYNVGMELAGKHLDEYASKEILKIWMDNMVYICEQGRPFMEIFDLDYAGKSHLECHTLNLPLRSGDRDFPDMFVCFESYNRK